MKEWGDPLFCLLIGYIAPKGRISLSENRKKSTAERVWDMAEPLAKELGLSIWDIQFVKEGADWYLRIFIDKEGGVTIDDCVDMTHAINPVLDKEDPISQEYMLEIFSPGWERKLTRPEHFQAYLGEAVRVKLVRPLEDGTRILEGVLIRAEQNGEFELQLDEETTAVFEKKECSVVNVIEEL